MNLLYAEIVEVFSEHGMRMGMIRVGGARKKIALDLLANPRCGDTVLLCDGVAIGRVEGGGRQTETNHVPGNTR
jgi:hydrogenase maturation factor